MVRKTRSTIFLQEENRKSFGENLVREWEKKRKGLGESDEEGKNRKWRVSSAFLRRERERDKASLLGKREIMHRLVRENRKCSQ